MMLTRRTHCTLTEVAAFLLALVAGTTSTATGLASSGPTPAAADVSTQTTLARARLSRVTGLRHAKHAGFDRVVIDLRGPAPDWNTRYLRHFHHEGSGKRVPIRGRSGLVMSLGADAHNLHGKNVYTGPRIARPGYRTLKFLALTGDMEGKVTFSFALRRRAPYRILALHHPRRLVLDFRR